MQRGPHLMNLDGQIRVHQTRQPYTLDIIIDKLKTM